MANFDVQIEALVGSSTQTEMDDWMTEGAKEVINILPYQLKIKASSITNLYISNTDTTLDMDGKGEILHVTRENADSGYYTPCREIPPSFGDLSNDSTNMMYYATATDPVYWIDTNSSGNSTLFVKPTPTETQPAKITHITYPSIDASAASSIANFPDEAEYLIVLYASIKSLQNKMLEIVNNANVGLALTAANTELDETQNVCDLINTQIDSAVSELGEAATLVDTSIDTAVAAITTALGRVNTAVALANTEFDLVNAEVDLANVAADDEDVELVGAYINTAQGYTMAGKNYLDEANASLSEAQGYASEVQARGSQVNAQVAVAQSYIAAAQGFVSEVQSKVTISNGYLSEANARMQEDAQQHQLYQIQQTKLQQDYDRGTQMLVAQYMPAQPVKGE